MDITKIGTEKIFPDLSTLKGSSLDPAEGRWANWLPEVTALESKYPSYNLENGAVVFIGSSSIRLWSTLERDFPDLPVVKNGFGGSEIVDSVYFADRLVIPLRPHTVVMYAGSNDIARSKPPTQLLADYIAFIRRVHAALPETRIYYISIAPCPARWAKREQMMEANRLIQAYTATDERLKFIDVYPHMLGADDLPILELYAADGLHLSGAGYDLWKQIVGTHLYGRL